MDLVKGTQLGNYELVMRIGRGGMATVWVAHEHATQPEDDRLVAVKAMLADLADEPEFVRMFLDEVRLIRAIRHPNIVDVYDVGEEDGVMWMAMEWVEGESLHSVIAEAGKRRAIPPEIAVQIIADAAAGLHAAHELRDIDGTPQELVHRDVSPHNILISTSGQVKLVDFGVAKAVGRMSDQTRSGQLKGKFGYMSPEQATGNEVDRRSDVFALGVVLYELTTSRRLFRGESDLDTLRLVTSGQIPRPTKLDPSYPAGLERVVLKALERSVERRYQTAADLEGELRDFLKAERVVVPRSGVAGLLKRVMGSRIEQRRRAVRKALKTLQVPESVKLPELISHDPAFTPVDGERGDEQGELSEPSNITNISDVSSLSQVGSAHATDTGARASKGLRVVVVLLLALSAVLGYFLYETRLKAALFPRSTSPTGTDPEPAFETTRPPKDGKAPDMASQARGAGDKPPGKDPRMPTVSLDELEVELPPRPRQEPQPAASQQPAASAELTEPQRPTLSLAPAASQASTRPQRPTPPLEPAASQEPTRPQRPSQPQQTAQPPAPQRPTQPQP
jgi:serine/threonine-protein kinase